MTVLSKAVKIKGTEQPVAVMCFGHGCCWRGAFSSSRGSELDREPETCQGLISSIMSGGTIFRIPFLSLAEIWSDVSRTRNYTITHDD